MSLEKEMIEVRKEFPALNQKINGHDLVYLDSTNTTLKPRSLIERVNRFYSFESSNVHRGGYTLSNKTTESFEKARERVAKFIGARISDEVIFTKGTTESINLVAATWGERELGPGDEIILSEMEHHANIVPWQILQKKKGFKILVCPITPSGDLDMLGFKNLLSSKTKLVALTACSNTLGTFNPVSEIVRLAKSFKAKVLLDGAQWVAQRPTQVAQWDVDFFAFSAHKVFGPTGLGILYVKQEILNDLPPYQGGGSMIKRVSFSGTTFNDIPHRFEAGTPHIEGAVCLPTALDFLDGLGFEKIQSWEALLYQKLTDQLAGINGLQMFGSSKEKAPIQSFYMDGLHPSDISQVLDQQGVCVRAGHHCTQPLMEKFGVSGTVRVSISVYNDFSDVEKFILGLKKAQELLQ